MVSYRFGQRVGARLQAEPGAWWSLAVVVAASVILLLTRAAGPDPTDTASLAADDALRFELPVTDPPAARASASLPEAREEPPRPVLDAFPDSTADYEAAVRFWLNRGNPAEAAALAARWPGAEDGRDRLLAPVGGYLRRRWTACLRPELAAYAERTAAAEGAAGTEAGPLPPAAASPDEITVLDRRLPPEAALCIAHNAFLEFRRRNRDLPRFVTRALIRHTLRNQPLAAAAWPAPPDQRLPYSNTREALREAFTRNHIDAPMLVKARGLMETWRTGGNAIQEWLLRILPGAMEINEVLLSGPRSRATPLQLVRDMCPALAATWRREACRQLLRDPRLRAFVEGADDLGALVKSSAAGISPEDLARACTAHPRWRRALAVFDYREALGTIPATADLLGLREDIPGATEWLAERVEAERRALADESFPWVAILLEAGARTPPRLWAGSQRLSARSRQRLNACTRELRDLSPMALFDAMQQVAARAKAEAERDSLRRAASLFAANRALFSTDPLGAGATNP